MNQHDEQLERYIDRLNAGETPSLSDVRDAELRGLLETAQWLWRLRKPEWPTSDFPSQMAARLARELQPPHTRVMQDEEQLPLMLEGRPKRPPNRAMRETSGRRDSPSEPGWRGRFRQALEMVAAVLVLVLFTGLLVAVFRNGGEEPESPQSDGQPALEAREASSSTEVLASAEHADGQIAYVSAGFRSPEDGHHQIYVVDADGSNPRNLTNHAGTHVEPVWSPDGGQIAFISTRDGFQELYVINADGSNLRRLTHNEWNEQSPAWSPDGQQIAFDCYPEREYGGQADSQICVIDTDGSDLRNLSENGVNGFGPQWSPDGRQIAFVGWGTENGFDQIFVVNADGTDLQQVTDNPNGSSMDPVWSPDGQQIAYASAKGTGPGIYVMDANGSNQRQISENSDHSDYAPVWSPDGRQIAFLSAKDRQTAVRVVDADGSNLRELSNYPAYGMRPAWSPDGQQIVFVSESKLQAVNVDGSDLRTIADQVAAGSAPIWRPSGPPDSGEVMDKPVPTTEQPTPSDTPPLAEVYASVEQTLRDHPDTLYHVTVEMDTDAGLYSHQGTNEMWIDVDRNVVRSEMTSDRFGTLSTIIRDGARYRQEPYDEVSTTTAPTCYEAVEATSAVLGCPGPTERSTTTVERDVYDGQPSIVLVTTGTSSGSDERSTFTTRLYLDATTFLPIVEETEGTLDYGTVVPLRARQMYQHEFIPEDTVPENFFDPAAIGYVNPEHAERLADPDLGITAYWLGEEFDPENGLPRVVLGSVQIPEPIPAPSYAVVPDYRPADEPFGAGVVVLQEWSAADWQAGAGASFHAHWDIKPCQRQEEISLPDGRAMIYMGYEAQPGQQPDGQTGTGTDCTEQMLNRFNAVVELGETVIQVDAPGASQAGSVTMSPYNSRDGMEAVVRSLQAR